MSDELWLSVVTLAEKFRESAPEGMIGVVDIDTFDGRTYRPINVQERPPWLVLEIAEPEDETPREIVFLREEAIGRIRISREKSDKPGIGFSYGDHVTGE